MKKFLLITLALAAMAGCTKWITSDTGDDSLTKDFKHTGCSPQTRGLYTDDPSLLTIKYENGCLRVTQTNAELNCAFKSRGLTCKVSIEDDIIHYNVVYEKEEEMVANCICLVEKMTSAVTGLEIGKKYTLDYSVLGFGLKPITFTFNKDLHQIYNVESMYDFVVIE